MLPGHRRRAGPMMSSATPVPSYPRTILARDRSSTRELIVASTPPAATVRAALLRPSGQNLDQPFPAHRLAAITTWLRPFFFAA